jgi:Kef-type K+ transport system membrane component KefB
VIDASEVMPLIVAVGVILAAALLVKGACERARLPPLAGYLLLGIAGAALDAKLSIFDERDLRIIGVLGQFGVIVLLFSVGMNSKLGSLFKQLRRAGPVWVLNMLVAGVAGYATVRYLLGFDVLASVVAGVALTATSVGVPSEEWERRGLIDTDEGQLFVDVAELDDISGVLLMALLFAVLPAMMRDTTDHGESAEATSPSTQTVEFALSSIPWSEVGVTAAALLGKLVLLAAACALFAKFVIKPLVRAVRRWECGADAAISITAVGAIIAGAAGLLGFSVAIGAFFAGLAFSSRGEQITSQGALETLRDVSVPFFFVSVGLEVDPTLLGELALPATAIFVAAVAGKFVGAAAPAWPMLGAGGATLLGLSMIPRAEITLIVLSQGLAIGGGAIPQRLFDATVLAAAATCITAPIGMAAVMRLHFGDQSK